jgi:hypothetical protein
LDDRQDACPTNFATPHQIIISFGHYFSVRYNPADVSTTFESGAKIEYDLSRVVLGIMILVSALYGALMAETLNMNHEDAAAK